MLRTTECTGHVKDRFVTKLAIVPLAAAETPEGAGRDGQRSDHGRVITTARTLLRPDRAPTRR